MAPGYFPSQLDDLQRVLVVRSGNIIWFSSPHCRIYFPHTSRRALSGLVLISTGGWSTGALAVNYPSVPGSIFPASIFINLLLLDAVNQENS